MYRGPSTSRNASRKAPRKPNLIPIMNLFIVVIPMLMTIMVSAHLTMLEINLSVAGGGGEQQQKDEQEEIPKVIKLMLLTDGFEIEVEGNSNIQTIPLIETGDNTFEYDLVSLDQKIAIMKKNHENQNTIEVLPHNEVKYDILLRAIDICKSNDFPFIKYYQLTKKYLRHK